MPTSKDPSVFRKSTIRDLHLRNADIHSSKLYNCKLQRCRVFNSTLNDCQAWETVIHESQVYKSTLHILGDGCTITRAQLPLTKFTPELRLMLFKHIIEEQAATKKSFTLPLIKALRVCKDNYYREALEVYYKLVPFPIDQHRWRAPYWIPQSVGNCIRRVVLDVENWNPSTQPWFTAPRFPAVVEVNLHGLAEHLAPQQLMSSWLQFCQDRFDALTTFRLTFPLIDEEEEEGGDYRDNADRWLDACRNHFDVDGELEVMRNSIGDEEVWCWKAPLGRKFKALARARAKVKNSSS